jgi:hypothetical protein
MSDTNTRWGVWRLDTGKWSQATVVDGGYESIASTFSVVADINRLSDKVVAEVRPYPAPTPPATVEGEYTAGIRAEIDAICNIYRTVGEAMYNEPRERLVMRIDQRFNTLAAENKRLRLLLEILMRFSSGDTSDDATLVLATLIDKAGFQDREDKGERPGAFVRRIARTALAGGAS